MWDSIIGQERVIKILKNVYSNNKIAHSYIFSGKEGVGKDAVAIEFAKLINCDSKINGTDACNKCIPCRQINSLNSIHFKFITALPTGKKELSEDENILSSLKAEDRENYLLEIEKKSSDNYYKINIPNANDIRIDSIRQIRKEIYLTGEKGKKKIFVLSNADRMNTQSSNAFLKILEDPPGDSLIILTTSRINSLLPTITGRCQIISFDAINKDNLAKFLMHIKENLSLEEAEFYANIADGSISKCRNIIDSYYLELREMSINLLASLLSKSYIELGKIISNVVAYKDKEKVRQFLFMLIYWFRDISSINCGEMKNIINVDKIERLVKFDKRFSSDNYKIINLIEDAIRDIDMNINLELLIYNLVYKIKYLIKTV
jgi:DNA polymerase III subunit delta'